MIQYNRWSVVRLVLSVSLVSVAVGSGCATSAHGPSSRGGKKTGASSGNSGASRNKPAVTSVAVENPRAGGTGGGAGTTGANTTPGGGPNDRDSQEYQDIYRTYSQGELDAAYRKIEVFERTYARSRWIPHAMNLKGLILVSQQSSETAILFFRRAIEGIGDDTKNRSYFYYNLATAQSESGEYDGALASLDAIDKEAIDASTRVKVLYLNARIYHKKLMYPEAFGLLAKAANLFHGLPAQQQTPEVRNTIEKQMAAIVTELKDLDQNGDALLGQVGETWLRDLITHSIGKGCFEKDRLICSEKYLTQHLEAFPQSVYANRSREILQQIEGNRHAAANRIGLLAPMTGKFSKFGLQTLLGVSAALKFFTPDAQSALGEGFGGENLELIVEDSGETAEQGVAALERLVNNGQVVAVIGPLLSKGIDKITQRAQELRIPLISLAQQTGVASDYVFYASLSPQQQVNAIVDFAMESKKQRKFAIIYPKTRLAEEFAHLFWDAVLEKGGEVVGFESYNPDENDFRQPVDKISSLYFTDQRLREEEDLALQRKQNKITKKTRMTEKYFVLPPVVDFEAVFIPDEARVVSQILPTFAYRDIENITPLGISTWNSPSLISRAGDYAEGVFFTDVFNPESSLPEYRQFRSDFSGLFGYTPAFSETLAFDISSLVGTVLKSIGPSGNRIDFKNTLNSSGNLQGALGTLQVKDHLIQAPLKIFGVAKKQFIVVN